MPHGGTDLVGQLRQDRRGPRRLDDPAEGGRLPDRPPGGELAAARGRGRRGPEAGPGADRGPAPAVGRHRPGQVGRREPGRDRPEARRAGRHRRATPTLVRAVVHNFGPSQADGVGVRLIVDGALGPDADGRPAGRRGPAGRLQPHVRRRPATTSSRSRSTTTRSSSTTAGGWPSRSASRSTSCSSTATSRASRSRPRPTTWPQALSPESTSTGAPVGDPDRGRPRGAARPPRACALRRGRPLQHRPVHRGRGRRARRLPQARRAAWSSSAATRSCADNYNRLCSTPRTARGRAPARVGRPERGRRREEGVGVRVQPAGVPAPDRRAVRRRARRRSWRA